MLERSQLQVIQYKLGLNLAHRCERSLLRQAEKQVEAGALLEEITIKTYS
jgi:hypothetical protein